MIVTESSAPTFTPCPAGTYLARLCRLIDLGTQKTEFQGETKTARKVLLTWEILDPDTYTDQGKPYTVSKRYTLSLHEKSALRRDLASWRGRDFTDDELKGFDLQAVLGKTCLLAIVHSTKEGRTFANVASISKPIKGLTGSEPTEPLIHFDLAKPDWQVFDDLGDKLKAQIGASLEYLAARTAVQPAAGAPTYGDLDDDLPAF